MKKGFTLIELLATIVIIAIIAVITYPVIGNIITIVREKAFVQSRNGLIESAKIYSTNNPGILPLNAGDITEIPISTLVSNNYIKSIKSPTDGTICGGYILIIKKADLSYEYDPQYRCGTSSSITSRANDSLILNYTFDDFQEPTVNLATYNTTMSQLPLSTSYNPTAYMTVEKTSKNRYKATYNSDITYSNGIVGLLETTIPIGTYSISANTLGYYIAPGSTAIHGLGFISNGSPGFTSLGYYSTQFIRATANNFGVRIGAGTINAGSYIEWENLQIEAKPYSTPFTEGTRTGTITDYSLSHYDSPLSIDLTPRWIEDRNGSYYFDGTKYFLSATNDTLNSFTFTSWINPLYYGNSTSKVPTGLGDSSNIISLMRATGGYASGPFWLEYRQNGSLDVYIRNVVSTTIRAVVPRINVDEWTQLAVTYNHLTGLAIVYLNGEIVTSITNSSVGSLGLFNRLYAGTGLGVLTTGTNYNGKIDQVKLYQRELSLEEIKTLYYTEKLN